MSKCSCLSCQDHHDMWHWYKNYQIAELTQTIEYYMLAFLYPLYRDGHRNGDKTQRIQEETSQKISKMTRPWQYSHSNQGHSKTQWTYKTNKIQDKNTVPIIAKVTDK